MSAPPDRFMLAPQWRWSAEGGQLTLTNPAASRALGLEGPVVAMAGLFERLARGPQRAEEIAAALPGEDATALCEALREQGVLRLCAERPRPVVTGQSPLAHRVRRLVARGGWRLPEVSVIVPGAVPPRARAGLALIAVDGGLAAASGDASPCIHCLFLRRLGRTLEGGAWRRSDGAVLGPHGCPLDALLAELLAEIECRPPGPGEGVLVRPGSLRRVPFLEHPDCPRCGRAALDRSAREIQRALGRPSQAGEPHQAWTDLDVGPLTIREMADPGGRFPFGVPFVWGSPRLVRELEGRIASVSTEGGLYGKGLDAETCRRLAVSEGVERLAALGVRADGTARLAARERQIFRALYATATANEAARARPWVQGFDLLRQRGVKLPLESVAVALPRHAARNLCHREPFYSGAASHLTLAEAAVHATLEVLERDAFMIAWYRRRRLPALSWPAALTPLAEGRARYLLERGFALELFDLRLDLPFPMLLLRATAGHANANWPAEGAMLFASGAFSAPRALERVLALACGQFLSLGIEVADDRNPLDPRAVSSRGRKHAAWPLLVRYLDGRRRAAHDFLRGPQVPFEAIAGDEPASSTEALARLGAALKGAGLDWFLARLTDAPTRRAGFEVAKVVIPGLVRLAPSRNAVDLALPRLHRDWPLAQPGLHREPHPLY